MSGDLLREAAVLLRDGAEALPERFLIEVTKDTPEDMHPGVGLALADWLDFAAIEAEGAEFVAHNAANHVMSGVEPAYPPATKRALAVARAILGRPS